MPRRPARFVALILIAASLTAPVFAAEGEDEWKDKNGAERFGPLAWLEGEWKGYGRFPDRINYLHLSYTYDIGGMYLIERTMALFPPEEPSTDFEAHQDFTVYYRDSATGSFRAKGFFIEAFVMSSTVEISDGGALIVVESTDVENGPPGMRSRYTISRETDDAFTATFEVAMAGGDY